MIIKKEVEKNPVPRQINGSRVHQGKESKELGGGKQDKFDVLGRREDIRKKWSH